MLPFIEKHKDKDSRNGKGYFGGINEEQSRVKFQNHAAFFMDAYLSSFEDGCDFTYGRRIEPVADNNGENDNFTGGIVSALKDCFDAEGFKISSGKYAAHGLPGIGFRGEGDVDTFDNYIRLVRMTEDVIDLKLKRFDQTRARPFAYSILKKKHGEDWDLNYFKRIENASDLNGSEGVLVFAKELKSWTDSEQSMSISDGFLERIAEEYEGKILSVGEFLKGR